MSKKQALTEFHRGAILAAAGRLFAEKGTEKTTMDDIAREAEYSKATLYVYFQSKEEIMNAILLSGMALLHKRLYKAVHSSENWFEAYEAIYESIIRFYEENPSTYESAAKQLSNISIAGEEGKECSELERISGEINQELLLFLERGVSDGIVIKDTPCGELLLFFWGTLSGLVHTAYKAGRYLTTTYGLNSGEFLRDAALFLRAGMTGGKQYPKIEG